MIRERIKGPSITYRSTAFGMEVHIDRRSGSGEGNAKMYPSGDNTGQEETKAPSEHREVIPRNNIGSEETKDIMLPPPQYVDTVPYYATEQNDPKLHGPAEAMRSAERHPPEFRSYADFEPRTEPMPRAAQDELYLEGYGKNVADPRMTDHDSDMNLLPREIPDRVDLFGKNRDGVLHNENKMPMKNKASTGAVLD